MNRCSFFLALALSLPGLAACSADSGDESATTEDALRKKKPSAPKGPELEVPPSGPSAPPEAPGEGAGPLPELPGATPAPEPTLPSVCTHNKTENACLSDPGCAWGIRDLKVGHECYYVGEIIPFGK